jgi:hypothetical protein
MCHAQRVRQFTVRMKFIQAVKSLPRLVDDARAARLRAIPAVVLMGRMVERLTPDGLPAPCCRVL